jgi:hypothetical protein
MPTSASASSPARPPGAVTSRYSCVLCKARKVRCEGSRPCSGCVRAGVECVARTRAPYKRHRQARSSKLPEALPTPDTEGTTLNDSDKGSDRSSIPPPDTSVSHVQPSLSFGQ